MEYKPSWITSKAEEVEVDEVCVVVVIMAE
jgi:hypothetical protein